MSTFVVGMSAQSWWLVLAAAVAPLPASLLWGRQYGAGLTAAATALWVLPPTIFAAAGFWIYWVLEKGFSTLPVDRAVKGDEPVEYQHF
jgi:hypothetical protein